MVNAFASSKPAPEEAICLSLDLEQRIESNPVNIIRLRNCRRVVEECGEWNDTQKIRENCSLLPCTADVAY